MSYSRRPGRERRDILDDEPLTHRDIQPLEVSICAVGDRQVDTSLKRSPDRRVSDRDGQRTGRRVSDLNGILRGVDPDGRGVDYIDV